MNDQIKNILKLKLSIENSTSDDKKIPDKKYNLNNNMEKFGIDKVFITSFLTTLWKTPEVIHHILLNTEPEIVQANLASFIVNDFYCNLLSGNYLEKIIYYML